MLLPQLNCSSHIKSPVTTKVTGDLRILTRYLATRLTSPSIPY